MTGAAPVVVGVPPPVDVPPVEVDVGWAFEKRTIVVAEASLATFPAASSSQSESR